MPVVERPGGPRRGQPDRPVAGRCDDPATWVTDRVNLAGWLLRSYDDRDFAHLLPEVVDPLRPAIAHDDVEGRAGPRSR